MSTFKSADSTTASRRSNRRKAIIACALAFLLLACGPFFPDTLLLEGDAAVLAVGSASFYRELAAIAPATTVPFHYVNDSPTHAKYDSPSALPQAAIACDCDELADVLAEHGELSAQRKNEIVDAYRAARELAARPRMNAFLYPVPKAIDGLPGEFADYLTGLTARSRGDVATAAAAWGRLLDRPVAERSHRTLWAMHMLARLDGDPDRAVQLFRTLRDAASSGAFTDREGLAAASLGWEAQLELKRDHYSHAIELYLEQQSTGDPSAVMSLMMTARAIFQTGGEALTAAAADAKSREVIDVFILSRSGQWRTDLTFATTDQIEKWLAAMQSAGISDERHAARYAWMSYQNGDFDLAQRWIDKASPNSAAAEWLRSKLQLREGALDQAAITLSHAVELLRDNARNDADDAMRFDSNSISSDRDFTFFSTTFNQSREQADLARTIARQRAAGELGVIQLSRRDFRDALARLLDGGFWNDAAYVAEQVMTIDELKSFVDGRPTMEIAMALPSRRSRRRWPTDGQKLRDLFARRLMRSHRDTEARPYFCDTTTRQQFDRYEAAIRNATDTSLDKLTRGRSYVTAARILRGSGAELIGTELEPDFGIHDGRYETSTIAETRLKGSGYSPRPTTLRATTEESNRVADANTPTLRWHYRYKAAELAWRGANLLPDQSVELAEILRDGGDWIKARDPAAAEPFYRALITRCDKTDIGKRALDKTWIPDSPRLRDSD